MTPAESFSRVIDPSFMDSTSALNAYGTDANDRSEELLKTIDAIIEPYS